VVAALAVIVRRGIAKRQAAALQQKHRLSLRLVMPIRLLLEAAAGQVRKAVLRFLRRSLLLVVVAPSAVLAALAVQALVVAVAPLAVLVPQVRVTVVVLVVAMAAVVAVEPLLPVAMHLRRITQVTAVPAGHQRLLVLA